MPNRRRVVRKAVKKRVEETPVSSLPKTAQIFLREIKRNYSDAMFITREDLLQLPVFGHVSTITRYQMICKLVTSLVEERELIQKGHTNLCLKSKANMYDEKPLRLQYYDTIKALATKMSKGKAFDVMTLVDAWTTDPHLTANNKRVAVRQTMSRLVKEDAIKQHDEFRYVTKGKV